MQKHDLKRQKRSPNVFESGGVTNTGGDHSNTDASSRPLHRARAFAEMRKRPGCAFGIPYSIGMCDGQQLTVDRGAYNRLAGRHPRTHRSAISQQNEAVPGRGPVVWAIPGSAAAKYYNPPVGFNDWITITHR